ncbi:MAG: RNA polymerase factor sigma-54 [Candidatus Caldatribacteriota bacterium]|nr:RNA polymerase factor sigma-54 [Candidatus Caldatribacteriota bacterium]
MKPELSLIQKQKLILTPQLYQAINILQLNLVELKNLIDEELVDNPLLEVKQETGSIIEKANQEEKTLTQIEHPNERREENNFDDWLSYLKEKEYRHLPDRPVAEKENRYENFIYYKESLQDYLLIQLGTAVSSDIDYKIGEYIIGNIDDNGYLTISLDDISLDLNIKRNNIKEILSLIQSFDPPGVGARKLQECLLIQAKYLGISDIKIEKIIKYHLQDLAQKSFKKIAKDLKISVSEVQSLADVIKNSFDPKPGRRVGSFKEVKYILPDLVIMRKRGGGYRVILNDRYLPQIKINHCYKTVLEAGNNASPYSKGKPVKKGNISDHKTKDAKEYIEKKLNSAKWLIAGIEQRKKTIYRIAETLVEYQKDFLDKGILFIKPLTLREVADKLDIHESTVSRAIHNKMVQTPRGLLRMKFLFSKGVDKKSGDTVSTDKVKKLIKEYINNENCLKPWSDQKLADLLSEKGGVNISRRTVAKYREILKIPSSNLRKRFET